MKSVWNGLRLSHRWRGILHVPCAVLLGVLLLGLCSASADDKPAANLAQYRGQPFLRPPPMTRRLLVPDP